MAGGGAERQLTYLASEFVRCGWDVHIALLHGGPNLPRLTASGAVVHRVPGLTNYDPRILFRLVRIIRTVKPDVIQCWLLQMELLGGLAALLTRTPWVFSERASEEAYPRTLKIWLRRKIAWWATAIVSNSRAGDKYWESRTRKNAKRYIIPNALPLDEIANAARADATDEPTERGPLLLNAGRFESQKNFDAFIRAIHLVRLERPVRALCCGEGSLRGTFERLIGELGLTEHASLAGYTPNLWGLMKRADVFVSTSWFEGSPNVVLEAMACGCPLVVSDIPTHREILNEATTAFVDPHSPRQIADTIVAVLNDREGAARRAKLARLEVGRYSLSAVARQYAQVYGEISTRDDRGVTPTD
jgi:glycosyltransferase involved in cell wall biosynthesis